MKMEITVTEALETDKILLASCIEPNLSGNCGQYFSVLNWASGKSPKNKIAGIQIHSEAVFKEISTENLHMH